MRHTSLLTRITLLTLLALSAGCAGTGLRTRTGGGWIADFKEAYLVGNSSVVTKVGKACSTNILGVATGDASLEAAMKDGGIKTVSSVDSEITNILLVYGKNCTIVRGS